MPKKKENKFKKIILKWWFWVIVALVSYFIMVSMNIRWKGVGFDWGLLFAYLTQIAWMIVIVLIIMDGIKWIRKSKISDYWKTALTILGIVLIIVYVIFAVRSMGLFTGAKFLKDQNYEVLDYGYNDVMVSDISPSFAYVEMKAIGNREEQVSTGLIFLGNKYKDAGEYDVIILTESEECRYSIDGEIYRAYLFTLSHYWSTDNPILMNKTDIEEKLDYMIWASVLKTELTKIANEEETDKEYGAYDIEIMVEEYKKLNNSQIDRDTIYQIYNYHINDGFCE